MEPEWAEAGHQSCPRDGGDGAQDLVLAMDIGSGLQGPVLRPTEEIFKEREKACWEEQLAQVGRELCHKAFCWDDGGWEAPAQPWEEGGDQGGRGREGTEGEAGRGCYR